MAFCINTANETINKAIDNAVDKGVNESVERNEENKEIINVKNFFDKFSDHSFSIPLQQLIFASIGDEKGETDKTKRKSLEKLFEKTYKDDKVVKKIINAKACGLQKLPKALIKKGIVLSMRDLKIKNKRFYMKNRMYVSENEALQLHLLQQHHDPPIYGHPGYKAMYRKIQANYFWFDMIKHCKQYVSNCLTCRHTKAYMVQKQNLLNSLPIPNRKWMDLLLDFVVKLPKCCRRNWVFQHILMVVDRLTKQWLYELFETLHMSEFIDAMYYCVFALYKFPLTMVNDWREQMTATLWQRLCKRYKINIKFSSAHHPETDGQTKSANKIIKNYLRAYIAYT